MTPDELAAIERRADAATPGPWDPLFGGDDGTTGPASWWMTYDDPDDPRGRFDWPQIQADAAFIAHARADVPALIATVRALRAEVAALRREALLRDAGITTTSTAERA